MVKMERIQRIQGHGWFAPETNNANSSHLKMDGWNTIVCFWDGLFSGAVLSFKFRHIDHHCLSVNLD